MSAVGPGSGVLAGAGTASAAGAGCRVQRVVAAVLGGWGLPFPLEDEVDGAGMVSWAK